jgi:methionine synthase II (cobalamin-independent)
MTATTVGRAVQLLPRLGTTGIGSLPHTQLELGLQMALQVDIPYLPQLPIGNPGEYMIPAALDRLPGLRVDAEGGVIIDPDGWAEGREAFSREVESALASGDLEAFEPSVSACRAWNPFLFEVEHRKLMLAKVQLAGPATVRWVARTTKGDVASDVPQLDQQIYRLIMARALAMARAVRRAGATPLFYLDEPGLYALDRHDARHVVVLQELRLLVTALQHEGALVGLHCCSNTDWPLLFDLGLNLLAVDCRLSLDAVLDGGPGLLRFLDGGGALSLGIVPTDLSSTYSVEELVDAVETSLRATFRDERTLREVAARSLLTPACGMALRSVPDAERTFAEVRAAQSRLRGLLDAEAESPARPQ